MKSFWNFVADLGPVVYWIIGGIVVVLFLVYTIGGIHGLSSLTYRAIRYERHGVCGKCKQPFQETVVKPADQTYGPDSVSYAVCPNGHRSLVRGNRRWADWAGF